MPRRNLDLDLDGYTDWVVFDRTWETFSEPCTSLQEAEKLASRTGYGQIFKRQWESEY